MKDTGMIRTGQNTNPLGRGTDNVTVNMTHELHQALGRAAYNGGYRSKGEFIREAIKVMLRDAALMIVWGGCAFMTYGSVAGMDKQCRRRESRVARVVRVTRGPRRNETKGFFVV